MNRSLRVWWLGALILGAASLGCENHPVVVRPGDDPFEPHTGGAGGAADTNTTGISVGINGGSGGTGAGGSGGSAEPACGDGALDADEACDDGNSSPDDGCDDECQIEGPEWRCEVPGANCYECGNGVL